MSTSRVGTVMRTWAIFWSVVILLVFAGVTALTIGVWLTDPGHAETSPVADLAFFALGASIGLGLMSQARCPEGNIAGVHQAVVSIAALGLTGMMGRRVEPVVGSLVLLAVVAVLIALHPARRDVIRPGANLSPLLLALSAAAAVPAVRYAAGMVDLAADAGPSCFFGQCAAGDRLAELAAAAITVVVLGGLAAFVVPGWRLPLWSGGAAAVLIGSASLALTEAPGSLGRMGGSLAVAWGALMVAIGEWQARHRPEPMSRLPSRPSDDQIVWTSEREPA